MRLLQQRKKPMLRGEAGEEKKLLRLRSPFSVTEAYRGARTNLMFLPHEGNCQKIVVTSSLAGEGKSLNCANLAIALAQNGKRVILLDCDMRKPKVHHLFHRYQSPGLSEYLAGIEEQPAVHHSNDVEGLHILAAGGTPPNPTELLSSARMGQLFSLLEEQYDYILLDTPPVNVVSDALVLSDKVAGYIMLVRAEVTDRSDLEQALLKLRQVDANVLGFLLNDVNPKTAGYGLYGKHGRYAGAGRYGKYGYYGKQYGNNPAKDGYECVIPFQKFGKGEKAEV